MLSEENRSRRVKVFSVDANLLVDMLNGFAKFECISLPITLEIPRGARAVAVWANQATRCLDLLVEHESYSEVPEGFEPPRCDPYLQRAVFVRKKLADEFEAPR